MLLRCPGRAQKHVQPDSKTANSNSHATVQTAVFSTWGDDLSQRCAFHSGCLRLGCRRACGSQLQVALLPGLIKQRRCHVTEAVSVCPALPRQLYHHILVKLQLGRLESWTSAQGASSHWLRVDSTSKGQRSVCLSLHGCLYLQTSRNSHRCETAIFQGKNSLRFDRAREFRQAMRQLGTLYPIPKGNQLLPIAPVPTHKKHPDSRGLCHHLLLSPCLHKHPSAFKVRA